MVGSCMVRRPRKGEPDRTGRGSASMLGSKPTAACTPGRSPVVFIDANSFADRHLTGIGRYTARIALALAARGPVRFFSNGQELFPPPDLDRSPDQDLAQWGHRIWESPRAPMGPAPSASIGLFTCLRPIERQFPFE